MVLNPLNLKRFFKNLKTLYNRPEVPLEMIWNLYESKRCGYFPRALNYISMYCNIA